MHGSCVVGVFTCLLVYFMERWRVKRPLVYGSYVVGVFTCLLYGEVAGTAATSTLHQCGGGVYLSTVWGGGGYSGH